jgi:hypothetical protein
LQLKNRRTKIYTPAIAQLARDRVHHVRVLGLGHAAQTTLGNLITELRNVEAALACIQVLPVNDSGALVELRRLPGLLAAYGEFQAMSDNYMWARRVCMFFRDSFRNII